MILMLQKSLKKILETASIKLGLDGAVSSICPEFDGLIS
jgi:hypothetical protein